MGNEAFPEFQAQYLIIGISGEDFELNRLVSTTTVTVIRSETPFTCSIEGGPGWVLKPHANYIASLGV